MGGLTRRGFLTISALTAGLAASHAPAQELSDLVSKKETVQRIYNFGSIENFIKHYKKAKGIGAGHSEYSRTGSALSQQEIRLTPYIGQLVLPDIGKIGWYITDFRYAVLMYRGLDNQIQEVVWLNNNQSSLEPSTGIIESYRGIGFFNNNGSLDTKIYSMGNTITPKSPPVSNLTLHPSGDVEDAFGNKFRLYNAMHTDGSLFFGESENDGVYFTSQWASIRNADGNGRTMVLLDEGIAPWLTNWDLEIFAITKGDTTIFVLPAIGNERVGMEYNQVRRDKDGILKGMDPICPELLNNLPGCAGVDAAVPYAMDWWIKPTFDQDTLIDAINGRAVRAYSRDPTVLAEYPKRGPVSHDLRHFPQTKPFSGNI